MNPIVCGRWIWIYSNPTIQCPVSYWAINQYDRTTCRPSFSWVNPDTIGCVWTTEFDLNALRVDEEIFWTGKEKVAASSGHSLGPLGNEHLMSETQNILRDRRTYGAKAFWITCIFISRRTRLHLGTKHGQFFFVFVLKWREPVEEFINEERIGG